MENIISNILFSFLAALGFSIIFNIKGKNILFCSLGGMIGWCVYTFTFPIFSDDIIRYFVASVVISLYAQKMAKIRKAPALIFLVIAFIPLVPGYSIYKTMECLLIYDTNSFIEYAIHTFKIVMAIATGFLVSSKVITNFSIFKFKNT